MKSDLVDVAVQIFVRTERAVLVSDTGEKEDGVWLPLSQIETEQKPDGTAIVTMPEWLAAERGLV